MRRSLPRRRHLRIPPSSSPRPKTLNRLSKPQNSKGTHRTESKRLFGPSKIEGNGFQPYDSKLMSPSEAVSRFLIPPSATTPLVVGFSGFTGVSCPKAIPKAIVDYVDENDLQGKFKYDLFLGASSGPAIDDLFAERHLIQRRMPFCAGKSIQRAINTDEVDFLDQHLSTYTDRLMSGQYQARNHFGRRERRGDETQIDVAVIEATEITSEGAIIPGLGVGMSVEITQAASKIIIELNRNYSPHSFNGLHDLSQFRPIGRRHPFPLMKSEDRIGDAEIRVNPSRVVALIESKGQDAFAPHYPPDPICDSIASHLIEFIEHEITWGRLPAGPAGGVHLQSGVGAIADRVVAGFQNSSIEHARCYTEVLQDSFLPLIESGKILHASTTGIKLSKEGMNHFLDNFDFFKEKILIRNQHLSNSPEILSRIGLVSMNTSVECSIFGNINSSHIGSRVISGLGGSNDMTRHAALSFFHSPSTRKTPSDPHGISCIVPQVTSVDSTARDMMVFVTEQGLADLRGLSAIQRAQEIIKKTAHPQYRDQLEHYLDRAIFFNRKHGSMDTPQLFKHAFDMHVSLQERGTMKMPQNWLDETNLNQTRAQMQAQMQKQTQKQTQTENETEIEVERRKGIDQASQLDLGHLGMTTGNCGTLVDHSKEIQH